MIDAGVQEQAGTSIGEAKGAVYCLEEQATVFLPRTRHQHLSDRITPGYHSAEITEFAFVTSRMFLIPPPTSLSPSYLQCFLLLDVLVQAIMRKSHQHMVLMLRRIKRYWADTPGAHRTAEVMIIIKAIT